MSSVSPLIEQIERSQFRKNPLPAFRAGDTIRVWVLIKEGDKERSQAFEGVVIRKQHESVRETFTVRKISYGVGVERTFPLHSPSIESIEVINRGIVRRAKLFYLRELAGKAARIRTKKETRSHATQSTAKSS